MSLTHSPVDKLLPPLPLDGERGVGDGYAIEAYRYAIPSPSQHPHADTVIPVTPSSSMRSYPSTSVTPLSLHSAPNLARTWNSPEDSSRTPEVLYDHEPASPTGITLQRKKSSSRLLVSNLGRRLTRVGSVMRRNTSDSAVTGSSSLKDSIRSRESQSASPGGDGGDELGRKRRWIKTRLRSATLPEEANPVSVSTLGTGDREAVMMRREEEGDEDITRPFNVEHALHVSLDLSDLPAPWLEALRSQGFSESDLMLIQAVQKNANDRTKASLRPLHLRSSFPSPPALYTPSGPNPKPFLHGGSSISGNLGFDHDSTGSPKAGHHRGMSYFGRFSFEQSDALNEVNEEEVAGPTTPIAPGPATSSKVDTPVRKHTRPDRNRSMRHVSAARSTESSPAQTPRDRPAPQPSPKARKHKKRLSEQLRGFQSTFSTFGDDDDWAASLTAALHKDYDELFKDTQVKQAKSSPVERSIETPTLGHTRTQSEGLKSGEESEVVTPSSETYDHTADMGCPLPEPISQLNDRYNDPSPNHVIPPFAGLKLTSSLLPSLDHRQHSTSSSELSLRSHNKTPRTPELPPGAASPQINRRCSHAHHGSDTQAFSPSLSPSSYRQSRTPTSPSSVGHSRATSLDAGYRTSTYMPISHPSLGEAFGQSTGDPDIGIRTGSSDTTGVKVERHSMALSLLSSMSRRSMEGGSVHEATVQRAVAMTRIGLGTRTTGSLDGVTECTVLEYDSSCSAMQALDEAARRVAGLRQRSISGMSRFEDAD